jgi:hypothetical protein
LWALGQRNAWSRVAGWTAPTRRARAAPKVEVRDKASYNKDTLHIYLEPGLVARVAAEAFGLDPARLTVPPLDSPDLPHLRAAMGLWTPS